MLHLSKIALDNGGTIVPLIIPSEETNQTGLCNPSIYVDGDDILVNIRNVGYTLQHSIGAKHYKDEGGKFYTRWGPLSYIHPEQDHNLRTNNFFCEYDNKSNSITKHNLVDTTELDVEPNWLFIGLEDARIVRWDNKLYLTGVRRDVHPDGEGRMELSEIYITPSKVKEISRCRIEVPFESYCDKNWMPILDMPYHYVRWSNPLEIIKVDPEQGTSEIVHKSDNFLDVSWNEGQQEPFCGSSQVIPWDNGCRLAVIHECQWWRREERGYAYKDARYKHRILLWDSDWNLIKYTEPFTFMDGQVEFCCGVASVDDDLLITFGFQDNVAYLLKVNKDVINNLMKEKIDIVIQGQYDDYVDELIEHYKKLDFVNNIIVSCWEEDKESVSLNGVKFIRSKYPDDWGTGNRNLQIVSSLTGLKQVTTKYAVKVRSDQKYSHKCINDMYDYFIKNKESALKFELNKDKPKNSIITGGIFSPFPFHPRDHIFWGYKDDLIDLFNISLESSSNEKSNYDVTTNIRTESYIGTHYCSNFDNRLKLFLKEPEKYLYDNCEKINETLLISDKLTHKVFKSVPSNIIELEWPKYGWTKYKFDSQRERFGERWAEDFERE
jgi:hypothetical protein